MKECKVTEINLIVFTCLYRSPSQSHEMTNIQLIQNGNFNAKCLKWWTTNKNNTATLKIDSSTTSGYNQMITEQTDFINESSSFS